MAMRVHNEADSDESDEQSGNQIGRVWSARTTRTEVRTHRSLESPPEWANTSDETENTETLEDTSPIHTDSKTQIEGKNQRRVKWTFDRYAPCIQHALDNTFYIWQEVS